MEEANLAEVFYGIQGEGLLLGVNQVFIRFAGCNLGCKYCDTKYAQEVPDEYKWGVGSGEWGVGRNPIPIDQLIGIIKKFGVHYHSISLTGGEPLLQTDFILEFLALIPHPFSLLPIYLETNGTLPGELKKVIRYLDIIAMDIKLPSSTGEKEFWEEHKEFLAIAKGRKVFIKLVITGETRLRDLKKAISLVKEIGPNIPFILQPDTNNPPSKEMLFDYQRKGGLFLNEVRIIPQVHKLMGWR